MLSYVGSKDKFVNILVNMTGDKVRMYEWVSGEIRKFYPARIRLPEEPIFVTPSYQNRPVFFILKQEELNELRKTERTLDDIAVIRNHRLGRNGKEVVYLVWAKDMSTRIHLYNKASDYIPPIMSC